jgi:putative peptidoglycan lipid II flippase
MNETSPSKHPKAEKPSSSTHRILKSTAIFSFITLISRVLGLVREQVRAYYLGTGLASDALGIAFQLPNLLRRWVAEGAMSTGFIPICSRLRQSEGDEAAFSFTRRYFHLALLILTVITALGMIFAGTLILGFSSLGHRTLTPETMELTTSLTRWMFPYLALVSLAAVAQGLLNSFRVFWVSAMTSVLLNAAIIVSALGFCHSMKQPAYAFAYGVLIGGFLQFFFQVPYVFKLGFRWKPEFKPGKDVKKSILLLGPALLGAGVYQLNVLISQGIAWGLEEGSISSLQYSSRLLELTLGIFAVSLGTVLLPELSKHVAAKNISALQNLTHFSIRLCTFVCLPMVVALILLRKETVALLFQGGVFDAHSTLMTANALGWHMAGLLFIALNRILIQTFYAFHDTWRPFFTACVSFAVNIAACLLLSPYMSQGGIALANTLSALAQTLAIGFLLSKHLKIGVQAKTFESLFKSSLGVVVMGAVLIAAQHTWPTPLDSLHGLSLALPYITLVTLGASTYILSAKLLKNPEWNALFLMIKKRRA